MIFWSRARGLTFFSYGELCVLAVSRKLKIRLGSTLMVLREVGESGSEVKLDMVKERMSVGWSRLETGACGRSCLGRESLVLYRGQFSFLC